MKPWYTSKTLWFNSVLAFVTVIEANLGILRETMGPHAYLGLVGVIAASNAALRFVTSKKIGK